jgi:DNA-binding response OmpR family regulator
MPPRVLLVDDDQAVLLTLRAVLELNGFEVETAASADQACALLQASTFQIVMTDVRMENESSGLDVIHAAQQQSYRPVTAVLTAYPPKDDRWRTANVSSFFLKPISTRELVAQLGALLRSWQATRPAAP